MASPPHVSFRDRVRIVAQVAEAVVARFRTLLQEEGLEAMAATLGGEEAVGAALARWDLAGMQRAMEANADALEMAFGVARARFSMEHLRAAAVLRTEHRRLCRVMGELSSMAQEAPAAEAAGATAAVASRASPESPPQPSPHAPVPSPAPELQKEASGSEAVHAAVEAAAKAARGRDALAAGAARVRSLLAEAEALVQGSRQGPRKAPSLASLAASPLEAYAQSPPRRTGSALQLPWSAQSEAARGTGSDWREQSDGGRDDAGRRGRISPAAEEGTARPAAALLHTLRESIQMADDMLQRPVSRGSRRRRGGATPPSPPASAWTSVAQSRAETAALMDLAQRIGSIVENEGADEDSTRAELEAVLEDWEDQQHQHQQQHSRLSESPRSGARRSGVIDAPLRAFLASSAAAAVAAAPPPPRPRPRPLPPVRGNELAPALAAPARSLSAPRTRPAPEARRDASSVVVVEHPDRRRRGSFDHPPGSAHTPFPVPGSAHTPFHVPSSAHTPFHVPSSAHTLHPGADADAMRPPSSPTRWVLRSGGYVPAALAPPKEAPPQPMQRLRPAGAYRGTEQQQQQQQRVQQDARRTMPVASAAPSARLSTPSHRSQRRRNQAADERLDWARVVREAAIRHQVATGSSFVTQFK
jgi:hypothetical protein